jgi:hypothetical protein
MAFDLGGLLQQYLGSGATQPAPNATDHFEQAAQHAPPAVVSQGLAEAFRSDRTPSFGQMVGQLFGQANPQQRTGMVQQLLSSLGPNALAALTSSGALAGVLGRGAQAHSIPPEQVEKLSPEQVQQIATHAEQQNPSVIDKMSGFYAQHPTLVKTLGGAALSIALAKMANGMKGRG